MIKIIGFFTPWFLYAIITLLHYVLPGRWMDGYVRDSNTGKLLRYRLNGRLVLVVCIAIWFLLGYMDWVPFNWLYTVRWYSLAGACTFGLIFSLLSVLPFTPTGKGLLADLFLGRLENPQYFKGRIDAKMWLYMIGAIMLQLNVIAFVAHRIMEFWDVPRGIWLCAIMISYFVWDYMTFEKVHLYTYDLFAERVGFKLGFGCLTFYPYFYPIALWTAVELPDPGTPVWLLIIYALIFFSGWSIARGANMQKYFFKTEPERVFLGISPRTISDGRHTLLVSGFWGLSRHINYLGEVLMGVGIALSVGYPAIPWVWLYPLYYVFLLGTRQRDDDRRCRAKYGELWDTYKNEVKYRIIPGVY